MTQGLNIDKLKKIMVESYPAKVLRDLDGRTSSTKPTWSRKTTKKPFKKRPSPVKTADGLAEDEEYEEDDDDDTYALDDYYENDDYGDEGDYDDEYEEDEDQVAYIDDEGWFDADEETINAVDEMMSYDDAEYAAILTTYTEARGALAKARIARGFYPVVVPADSGMQPRFGRTGGKGKGKGKFSSQPRPKAKPKAKSKAKRQQTTSVGTS